MSEKEAWGYVRLSQEGDASLEEQKESIREYARENELNLVTTRNDGSNTSGFNDDRDGYQLLRGKIRAGDIDAVITRDRARMSRDFDERLRLIALFRDTGVEWHVTEVGDRLYLEDVQKAGMEAMHAMMDHVKKMIEIERSKKAIEKRVERGCYQGRTPIGLEFAEDKCHLVKNDRWDDVVRTFELLDEGVSYSAINDETGLEPHQISRMKGRGIEWYENVYEKYKAQPKVGE